MVYLVHQRRKSLEVHMLCMCSVLLITLMFIFHTAGLCCMLLSKNLIRSVEVKVYAI